MGIGSGIFLFVVGAIVAWALQFDIPGVDRMLIGYLLMGAGVVVFLISLVMVMRKRSTTSTVRQVDNTGTEQVTQRETRSDPADPMV
jgi:TM2 domain-containing membrane protein YozV